MIKQYVETKSVKTLPRIPLEGKIDLTYRCNNNCRHCWLRIPSDAKEKDNELSFGEIKGIMEQARKLGTRKWRISGGEPMLRPDFYEICDYVTRTSASYSINTNGTLITPKIAGLLKRKGSKMISLYGATQEVHDHITRSPGSFEAAMRGISYLKEAHVNFTIQITPMRDNYHQFNEMIELAKSLSKFYRLGALWLYLSAYRNTQKNKEISGERLTPVEIIGLNKPDVSYEEALKEENFCNSTRNKNKKLLSYCIANKNSFHIDPYGSMSFCNFIKIPSFRYNLREGTLKDAWSNFIPLLENRIVETDRHLSDCNTCKDKHDCYWCPIYSYLEHGNFFKKISHLCAITKEKNSFTKKWIKYNRAYFQTGGITFQVESDIPIRKDTFRPEINAFRVKKKGADTVFIRHLFRLPDIGERNLGHRLYYKPPWSIYKKGNSWIYLGISSIHGEKDLNRAAVISNNYNNAVVYSRNEEEFKNGGLYSLTMFTTDQILIGQLLADREGCYMHACGVIFNKKGFLFVGRSGAGKSTISLILKNHGGTILCDDRIIIRKHTEGFRIYGTWSRGDIPTVSPLSVSLKAIFFLEKSGNNKIIPIKDKRDSAKMLLTCLIKPMVTSEWLEKEIALIEKIVNEIPCYKIEFDTSGKIAEVIKKA